MPYLARMLLLYLSLYGGFLSAQERVRFREDFSRGPGEGSPLPLSWEEIRFRGVTIPTQYSLASEDGNTFLRAESHCGASGLARKIGFRHLQEAPLLRFRWRVHALLKKGDPRKKEGDDYPARVYIAFAYTPEKASFWEKAQFQLVKSLYGQFPPLHVLNYIWERALPPGTVVPSPYTERSMMIVLESGHHRLGQWVLEERNLLEDYRRIFADDPPPLDFLAIMSDSDNTCGSTRADFDDLELFAKEKE